MTMPLLNDIRRAADRLRRMVRLSPPPALGWSCDDLGDVLPRTDFASSVPMPPVRPLAGEGQGGGG